MYILFIILAILVCFLLGIIVLIQNPKGGGLSSNFSASSQLMGVQKTGDFLEKGTWFLAILLMFLTVGINFTAKSGSTKSGGAVDKEIINQASKPSAGANQFQAPAMPTQPAPAPAKKP